MEKQIDLIIFVSRLSLFPSFPNSLSVSAACRGGFLPTIEIQPEARAFGMGFDLLQNFYG